MTSNASLGRRLGQYLGLIYADEGQPRQPIGRRSWYDGGPFVSPRLNEDVDELRGRLDALEQRLRDV